MRDLNAGFNPEGLEDRVVVDLIKEENAILQDVPWMECEKGRQHETTIVTGYPSVVMRMYYEGVKPSKGTMASVVNSCATASTLMKYDKRMFDDTPANRREAFLAREIKKHKNALNMGVAGALIYGDLAKDPKGINGLAKTYSVYGNVRNTVCTDDKIASFSVFSAGGKANRRSIFLAGWSDTTMYGLYPQGSKSMGIDLGQVSYQYEKDAKGGDIQMGIQELNWNMGLSIDNFRYGGRIGDIDLQNAFITDKNTTGYVDLCALLRRLTAVVKSDGVTQRLYMDRLMFNALDMHFHAQTCGNAVTYKDLQQKFDGTFLGIPVLFNDAQNVDEAALTALS